MAVSELRRVFELLMLPGESPADMRAQWARLGDADKAELRAAARELIEEGGEESPQAAA